ncbi:hypothetical protein FPOAC2_11794 [Fusarium poae]|jgi:hypothetical protein|uniref:Uncharacterized protein n=1 Tax=Fusarium poae TaxID=36050 RepID=A0A1B8AEN3_FUSPO|nr:hypothetical protein FPOAC1_011490 [Fusarium poae]KAG8666679.1 hypothetical protein FPOAC1_011490 [Fusarium poae]OBS18930.1 hypothetical protein FPOA_10655 [Fusarium poae]
MARIAWDDDGDVSSISSGDSVDTLSPSDFEVLDMDEPMSSFETGIMTPTDSSFSFTPPATPSTQSYFSEQERWDDLVTTYRQAVNHVRELEDEMIDLRYRSLQPHISVDFERPDANRQSQPQIAMQSRYDINDDMQPSRMWNGTHVTPNLLPGAHQLRLELSEAVELSIVQLDTLSGKKTMVSLTTKSHGANIKQLLGFWEFSMPLEM